ncbi:MULTISPECIES: glycosyltransferase family 2 protein [Streptomyces]|uniref:glycosyltransferase family 2 protein n=1 Tax=Streptomyces TaxID=1883 RepID=UPI00140D7568|nr:MULTISPECIES: glycosyltransferase family 2 protein [Streptomyces]MDH6225392.1 glycosyltransferase involved in cell wall biosynthesis [Streptomyces sp. MJP52]
MVKLSVIVPFYNVRQYAPDTLRSLEANARPDVEFLLVDDCSTDETPALLERAERDLPGARLLRHERNRGIAAARNTGLEAARGRYVTFLDGDDWLAPGHHGRLIEAMEDLGCDFVRTDHVRSTGRERVVQRVPHGRRNVVMDPRGAILPADRSTSVDHPFVWADVYHRRLEDRGLLRFTEGLHTCEDRLWTWRLHRGAESFAVVNLYGVFYRRGVASSLTRIGDERQLDFLRAFDLVMAETAEDRDGEKLLPKVVRTYCAMMCHHLAADAEGRYQPQVGRKLRTLAAAALRRMPQDILERTLDSMDVERATRLRRLRRRPAVGAAA